MQLFRHVFGKIALQKLRVRLVAQGVTVGGQRMLQRFVIVVEFVDA